MEKGFRWLRSTMKTRSRGFHLWDEILETKQDVYLCFKVTDIKITLI